ncbi:unnamed protein product [Fusarium fujikuroi]|uniref:Exonuclease domain-containing protein n=1 Tax=Fusarium fujikuroi TaxID=5127 RepID=A0A9Q9UBG3_FUSFU|nr:unnamed protein product [Fusarium fujikuroi]
MASKATIVWKSSVDPELTWKGIWPMIGEFPWIGTIYDELGKRIFRHLQARNLWLRAYSSRQNLGGLPSGVNSPNCFAFSIPLPSLYKSTKTPQYQMFSSTKVLTQHNKAKHGKLPKTIPVQKQEIKVPIPQPLLEYHFKDPSYRRFPLLNMAVIHDRLILQCHSSQRLKKEGYNMGQENCNNGTKAAIRNKRIRAPNPDPLWPKRKAVALDCEMVWVRNGGREILSISVVDFFSGEVLVYSLVEPQEPIVDWRTHIHGIGPESLSMAMSQGRVLPGWAAARQQLFKHINTETVIVGQSLQHDLKWLRVSHVRIFDTAIVAAEAVSGTDFGFGRRWSLKSLCADLLKLRIRQGPEAHCALEDAMAAREVALWCICYPDKLKQWAKRAHKKSRTERPKEADHKKNGRRKVYHSHDGGEGNVGVPL